MKKTLRLMLSAAAATGLLSGCYGPFRLTKKLHRWNGEVGEPWVVEAAFLGLALIPVYGFAMVGDALVFNPIEFWGGKNPVTEGAGPTGALLIVPSPEGGMAAKDGSGRLLMTARSYGDIVVLRDPSGRELARRGALDLARGL